MANKGWSVNGAIAVTTSAHARLEKAVAEKRTFGVYIGRARVVTCASLTAAKMYVGGDKRYSIIAD